MSDLKKAAQQALEALGFSCPAPHLMSKHDAAVTALRAALAQPEQVIRGLHSITNEDRGVLTLCFADESSAEAFMASCTGDADEALIQRTALAQQEPRNQCGETCERAKLCAVCARGLEQEEPLSVEDLARALVASRVIDAAALDDPEGYDDGVTLERVRGLHRRLAALAQQEQEPVAWIAPNGELRKDRSARKFSEWAWCQEDYQPLYTHPPRREWVSLTEEEVWSQYQTLWPFHPAEEPRLAADISKFARAIEQACKEKNHG